MMILDLLIPFGLALLLGVAELVALHRHDRRERARRAAGGTERKPGGG